MAASSEEAVLILLKRSNLLSVSYTDLVIFYFRFAKIAVYDYIPRNHSRTHAFHRSDRCKNHKNCLRHEWNKSRQGLST